jgi:hypothetical protein
LARIFAELRLEKAPGYLFDARIRVSPDKSELFECDFEEHAVRAAQWLMTTLLGTTAVKMRAYTVECELGNSEDEDIANEDCIWQPRYVVRFRSLGGLPEARLIGHVEFLAGRPGALSQAYRMRKTGKYGSLRCVLGESSQWVRGWCTDYVEAISYSGC